MSGWVHHCVVCPASQRSQDILLSAPTLSAPTTKVCSTIIIDTDFHLEMKCPKMWCIHHNTCVTSFYISFMGNGWIPPPPPSPHSIPYSVWKYLICCGVYSNSWYRCINETIALKSGGVCRDISETYCKCTICAFLTDEPLNYH